MTKGEAIDFYDAIMKLKNGELNKEASVKYVLLRIKLKNLFDEFEKAKIEASDQTKPEGWKEGDSLEEWNKRFQPVIKAWLNEETDIDTHIFNISECDDFSSSNPEITGMKKDIILQNLLKQ